ncbi:hypothetical protein [Novosphingobium lindaniclasticum]|uniref:Uncharacterized protein n=1 Tax=Novosphingobium lindaniclasticum LE124 TaxID=1096930 RepID=T0HSU7_9SPHN|nr:hypothetical protein [Novosphingobium lindaniclasticum]EQB16167.1 hypothetical protein L284_09960 [Novosphingobium lindaniclasticum LE124]
MASKVDTALKASLAAAALLAGAGVGYYYGLFLPGQAARQEARELAVQDARRKQEDAQAKAQARERAEQSRRREAAQQEYQDCLNFAELSYKQRWTASCRAQHDADVSALADCADNLFATEEGCRARVAIRPERDCALPGGTARSYSDAREQRKAECLARLQSVSGQPGVQAPPVPSSMEGNGQPVDPASTF